MRRRLKEIFVFGIVLIFMFIFVLYISNSNADNTHGRDGGNISSPVPGSWFWALDKSLTEVDRLLKSLLRTRNKTCIYDCENLDDFTHHKTYPFFEEDFGIDQDISLRTWLKDSMIASFCDAKLKVYDRKFARLRNVTLQAFKWDVVNLAKGGEELTEFKNKYIRDDSKEILQPKKGLLTMACSQHEYMDELSSDEVTLLKYITFTKFDKDVNELDQLDRRKAIIRPDYVSNFTIAIAREDYANFYHVTLHMFNIFLMMIAFKQQPFQTSILVLDAHPKAEIDETLQILFGPLIRIGQLKRPTHFKDLVLSLPENKSPLSKFDFRSLGYLEEFRSFVLNQHHMSAVSSLNCKMLHITLIWRRDKVYHPRNIKGTTERKIFNEAELFSAIYEKYPQFCVQGFLLETLPMKEQLKIIKNTDILIGMHGAGLTHALYLPVTSGLIEFFPFKFRKMHRYHKLFEAIANWRGLHYTFWENDEERMEMNNYFTVVDKQKIAELVEKIVKMICS